LFDPRDKESSPPHNLDTNNVWQRQNLISRPSCLLHCQFMMAVFEIVAAACWLINACFALQQPSPASNPVVRTHNPPGWSDADTLRAVELSLIEARQSNGTQIFKNTTSFAQSWNGATLFSV
jgi:hypothetical protein